ncbi:hypothetical protein ES319_A12G037000v1 [Gossypium barbadense]|uniref:RNase H type-1 domain-containing protein n=3 Tax=Gossypium TaxID=3633 RepID=A0A5J5T667_GOSBA|nr:hypothetical protein ES319_A12G037000v1 [Gossypium barbadense]TYG88654.1 hypothetical protein ES288_A12G038700v1 [Gossypium darwinii]TYH94390.1 hypothetical protein ES332_A12G038700v1 [Gossypium tomentosum]
MLQSYFDFMSVYCSRFTWPQNFVKINCDASIDKDCTMVGISIICRDSNGSVIDWSNAIVSASFIEVAKDLAVRERFTTVVDDSRHIIRNRPMFGSPLWLKRQTNSLINL